MDELYREAKRRFLTRIDELKISGGTGLGNVSAGQTESKINCFDLEEFLRAGGKVKHLINPKTFEEAYRRIQEQAKSYLKTTVDRNKAQLQALLTTAAFQLMLSQQLHLEQAKIDQKKKNTLTYNGNRIGQPQVHLADTIALRRAQRDFRRAQTQLGSYSSASKVPPKPGHWLGSAERDVFFERQAARLKDEISGYYNDNAHLYSTVSARMAQARAASQESF